MTKLAANWPFLLMSQLVKGRFFLRPEIALGLGNHVARLMAAESGTTDERAERSIEIVCVDDRGKELKFLYGEEGNPNSDMESQYDDAPPGSVAIIPIKGVMLKYGTYCDYGATELASFIKEAAAHKNISAIVLDHDSGGGAVDAVAPLVQAIDFAKSTDKPIVASLDMACSAAYWTASATDYMVANNSVSAEVGSIGVMMSFYDVQPYLEEMGIKFHTIYSNESGEKNLAFENALKGEYDLIREDMLDPLARAFQASVKANRLGKINLDAKGILNGKTYFAADALEHGLIDRIGNSNTAVEIALAMSHARKFI